MEHKFDHHFIRQNCRLSVWRRYSHLSFILTWRLCFCHFCNIDIDCIIYLSCCVVLCRLPSFSQVSIQVRLRPSLIRFSVVRHWPFGAIDVRILPRLQRGCAGRPRPEGGGRRQAGELHQAARKKNFTRLVSAESPCRLHPTLFQCCIVSSDSNPRLWGCCFR